MIMKLTALGFNLVIGDTNLFHILFARKTINLNTDATPVTKCLVSCQI